MPGPPPKRAATRQRRNRVAGAATLSATARASEVPELPSIGRTKWHPMTLAWWESVWTDPISATFAASDKHGMLRLAALTNRWWKLPETSPLRVKFSAEIRQLESKFGLSPLDRRRLQVEIERGEDAEERTKTRAARRSRAAAPNGDPRSFLRVAK
ncbi:MAG: hypothetical protein AB7N24_17315 [Dehalococcoidia bacterium]